MVPNEAPTKYRDRDSLSVLLDCIAFLPFPWLAEHFSFSPCCHFVVIIVAYEPRLDRFASQLMQNNAQKSVSIFPSAQWLHLALFRLYRYDVCLVDTSDS